MERKSGRDDVNTTQRVCVRAAIHRIGLSQACQTYETVDVNIHSVKQSQGDKQKDPGFGFSNNGKERIGRQGACQ